METDLRTRIMAAAPAVGTRVYWGIRPQGSALPAIVMTTVSDERTQHMKGFNTYQAKRVQVDCYATTYAQATDLREAVIAGIVPAAEQGVTRFLRGFVNNSMSRGEDTTNGYVHRQMIDLTIWHD
jgi:hypothetical protein